MIRSHFNYFLSSTFYFKKNRVFCFLLGDPAALALRGDNSLYGYTTQTHRIPCSVTFYKILGQNNSVPIVHLHAGAGASLIEHNLVLDVTIYHVMIVA
jgi:hypothetical protein